MLPKFFALTCAVLVFPLAAAAQDCVDTFYLDDLSKGTTPDHIQTLPATPGAFGGDVVCVLSKGARGVEQHRSEFLPRTDTNSVMVEYTENRIRLRYTFLPENRTIDLAQCRWREGQVLDCVVDLGAGDGLFLLRKFDAAGQMQDARIVAMMDRGLISDTVLAFFQEVSPAQRQVGLEFVEAGQRFAMEPDDQGVRYSISGAAMNPVATLLFNQPDTLKFTYAYQRAVGGQQQNVASDKTIDKGTVDYVMNQLFRIETLMIKGVEGTRGFRF